MPAEQSAPTPLQIAAMRSFPGSAQQPGRCAPGPVYLVALSSKIFDLTRRGLSRRLGYYLRAPVAVAPSATQPRWSSPGHRLGKNTRRAALGFSTNSATACTVNPPDVSCSYRRSASAHPHSQPTHGLADRAIRTTDRTNRLLRDRRLRSRVARRDTALSAFDTAPTAGNEPRPKAHLPQVALPNTLVQPAAAIARQRAARVSGRPIGCAE